MLGPLHHPDLLAGTEGFEDAGVFRLDAERALVQTLDFFPPIVDDPRWFGRIAAANSLSDVYAMGGRPLTAMNIVGWPRELAIEILGEILAGGMDKIREAGAALCGGHSVHDAEIKYGLSVTGVVHPEKFWRNSGARPGDIAILTKPIGMGAVATAIKLEKTTPEIAQRAMEQMATLNKGAFDALVGLDVHGATDVTGFGLLGHGYEMTGGGKTTLRLRVADVPIFEGALGLARSGVVSGSSGRGRKNLATKVRCSPRIEAAKVALLFDAETSGGLIVAVDPRDAEQAVQRMRDAGTLASAVIGEFAAPSEFAVEVD